MNKEIEHRGGCLRSGPAGRLNREPRRSPRRNERDLFAAGGDAEQTGPAVLYIYVYY
jgi:hypothetical protein